MKVDEIRLAPPIRAAASESFAAVRMAGVLDSRATTRGGPQPDERQMPTLNRHSLDHDFSVG